MIDQFSQEQFEQALKSSLAQFTTSKKAVLGRVGFVQGELVYRIRLVGTNKRLMIRSSIDRSGYAAESGSDSIRIWAEYYYPKAEKWIALAKLDKWTTRVPGWEQRMEEKLEELYNLALNDSNKNGQLGANKPMEKMQPNKPESSNLLVPTGDGGSSQSPELASTSVASSSPPSPESIFDLGEQHIIEDDESEVELEPVKGPEPNKQQKAAIEADVNAAVRVLAGPGAGKTFTVARRYAFLLNNGASPDDIIAVTFNKTMADELLSRIIKVNPQVVDTAAERQVSTIHALCYRLLRAEGDRRRVAKEWQVKRALQDIIEKLWPYVESRPGYKEVLSWINSAKMKGLSKAGDFEYMSRCIDKFGNNVGGQLHESRRQLDEQMKRDGLLTFSDMLLDVEIKLKTNRAIREKYQTKYKWVITDESQDVSAQAMRILTTLAEPQNQFFAVGDCDQLLFRFVGATPEANLYDGFEKRYPDGMLFKLETNYRSTQVIVRTQLVLIKNNYDIACLSCNGKGELDVGNMVPPEAIDIIPNSVAEIMKDVIGPDVKIQTTDNDKVCQMCNGSGELTSGPYEEKYLKTLLPRPDALEGEPITFDEYDTPELEAKALVDSLIESFANGSEPGHIFVGARTRAQLGYLEGPLVREKIPFINIANPGGFWGSKHVQDVICYLRLAYNESDNEAFGRVFNIASNYNVHPWGERRGEYCHHRYLGKAFMSACQNSYKNIWLAASKKRSFKPGAEDLTSLLQEIQAEMAASETSADVIQFIIDECYKRYLQAEEGIVSEDEAENGKLDDFQTVMDVARDFTDVGEFIQYVADARKAAEDAKNKSWDKYVILSTIHRLKGLEREIVYGVGLSEGFMQGPVPIKAGLLPHTFSMTKPPANGVLPTGGKGRMEDELCVAFVLISRAKERIYLSGVRQYRKATMHASRFIKMMGIEG